MTRGAVFAFLSKERRVVNRKQHTHRWLVHGYRRQRLGIFIISDSVTNLKTFQAYNGANVSTFNLFCAFVSYTLKSMKLLYLGLFGCPIAMANSNVHSIFKHATMYAAYCDTARIVAIVKRSDKHLWRAINVFRSWNRLHDFVQEIFYVISWFLPIVTHPAILGRSINHWEIKLIFGSVQIAH